MHQVDSEGAVLNVTVVALCGVADQITRETLETLGC